MLAVNQLLLIFKTNINTQEKVDSLSLLFDKNPLISSWSVDLLDIDCVLRIEAYDGLTHKHIENVISKNGYKIEVLD